MAIAPLIKPLALSGGTLYTFSSAAEDLTLTFNNDANKFRFSHAVLLDIPDIKTPTNGENFIQFDAIDGAFGNLQSSDSVNLSESFQNYALNLESLLISSEDYNRDSKLNVSERIFWKWLKEIGAIRWREAASTEKSEGLQNVFIEEDDKSANTDPIKYKRVVKYITDIDVVNSVKNNKNAYSEIYIHIPNKDGNTPFVLFNTIEDNNYYPGMTILNKPEDPLDVEVLNGRSVGDTHPAGLSISAFYDQDVIGGLAAVNTGTKVNGVTGNWYDAVGNLANSYYTDQSFIDAFVDDIIKTNGALTTQYKRSRLDGVTLNFNHNDYNPISTSKTLQSISDWNASSDSGSFDFNCVLIYYDVYNSSSPEDSATNLYGVLFLNDTDPISGGGARITKLQKYKPNQVTKLNGNSYGFKVNLKFDVTADNIGVEKIINDYSSFSLDIFTDATITLQEATRALTDQNLEIVRLTESVAELKDLILNDTDKNEINKRLDELTQIIDRSKNIFADNKSLLELINRNYDEILNIYKNNTSLKIAYNLDVIKGGEGVFINRNTTNQVTIENLQQDFNLSVNPIGTLDLSNDNIITLIPFSNYYRHENAGLPLNTSANVIIKIDDTITRWKNGQKFRIVIKDAINLDTYPLIIYTDAIDRLKTGTNYNAFVGALTTNDFNSDGTAIFEIICINEKTLQFVIDKIN